MTRLEEVSEAAKRLQMDREWLQTAIRKAHENGESLRKIAEASGLSHEKVRSLIRSDQT